MLNNPNVVLANYYFDLNLISDDYDDNKFVNCAFANNVNYLVTNDRHFNILKKIEFPKINVINIEKFIDILISKI